MKIKEFLIPLEISPNKDVRLLAYKASMIIDTLESLEIMVVNIGYNNKLRINIKAKQKDKTILYTITKDSFSWNLNNP